MNLVRKGYFVEIQEDPQTGKRWSERWMDDQGRLVEYVEYNSSPEEMTISREKYHPESGLRHAIGEPASTVICMNSGVMFEEEWWFEGVHHREDGDAFIRRNRTNGSDEVRLRFIHGVEYEVTKKGMFPVPD